ncbi:hypothetical protein [Arthrobacter pityocampae]|uniref:hypothetical protein n=1 Tax=Arthrobacter pityocampae TaxID=547334 RepID=UPI003736F7AF
MTLRRSPVTATAALLTVLLVAGCSAANDSEPENQPSPTGDAATAVADPVSGTYTGTQTIELGAPPEDATHIRVDIKCLTTGTLVLEGGEEAVCELGDGASAIVFSGPLSPEQDSFTVTAEDPKINYELTVVYTNGESIQ